MQAIENYYNSSINDPIDKLKILEKWINDGKVTIQNLEQLLYLKSIAIHYAYNPILKRQIFASDNPKYILEIIKSLYFQHV